MHNSLNMNYLNWCNKLDVPFYTEFSELKNVPNIGLVELALQPGLNHCYDNTISAITFPISAVPLSAGSSHWYSIIDPDDTTLFKIIESIEEIIDEVLAPGTTNERSFIENFINDNSRAYNKCIEEMKLEDCKYCKDVYYNRNDKKFYNREKEIIENPLLSYITFSYDDQEIKFEAKKVKRRFGQDLDSGGGSQITILVTCTNELLNIPIIDGKVCFSVKGKICPGKTNLGNFGEESQMANLCFNSTVVLLTYDNIPKYPKIQQAFVMAKDNKGYIQIDYYFRNGNFVIDLISFEGVVRKILDV